MQKLVYLVFFTCLVGIGQAQTRKAIKDIDVASTKATFFGKTERLDQLIEKGEAIKGRGTAKQSKNLPPNFFGRKNSKIKRPELEHQGVDPLRFNAQQATSAGTIVPTVNMDGVSGSSPNDPSGAIGQNHYVQAINATRIGVFLKDGTLVETFNGNVFWENVDQRSAGDPIILYDTEYHQWIITEFAPQSTSLLLIAISEDEDPLGVYSVYAFATPNFPDYPKYGIWDNALVVSTNEQGPGQLHQYFIEREALMAGEKDVTVQRVTVNGNNTEAGFFVTTPVNWSGGPKPKESKPLAVKLNDSSWGEVSEDVIEIISFDIDFENPENTIVEELEIPTSPYDSNPCSVTGEGFQCVPQRDGGGLDAIPEVIMNVPQYRNFGTHESFVLSFVTDVTDGQNLAGVRWTEMRRVEGEDWKLYQEGTYSPDGLDRYMSSIAMDAEGNIGLAFNVSSEDEYVGVRLTGRNADDPLGEMTYDEIVVVDGRNGISSGGRFGDYAHMSVDPVDGQTFWHTTEYAGNGGQNSRTRIVSFKIAETRNNDLLAASIDAPVSGADLSATEAVSVSVVNPGAIDVTNFDLQLKLDGNVISTYTHVGTVAAGDTLEYTFDQTLDMSAVGDYNLSFVIVYTDDFEDNNVFKATIEQLVSVDGAIKMTSNKSGTCIEDALLPVAIRLFNNGFDTLKSADVDLVLNGEVQKTVAWTGNVARGRSIGIDESFTNMPSGTNSLKAVLRNVNNDTDGKMDDNEATFDIINDLNMEQLAIKIVPDNFPGEIGWIITDGEADGTLFARSNSYSGSTPGVEIVDFACLPTDACYRIFVFDTFGDGFCCGGNGNGSYELIAPDGTVLFSGPGDFEEFRSTDFCVGNGCQLEVLVEVSNATGNTPGSILLTASGGSDYEYSIDNGASFQNAPVFDGLDAGTYEVIVKAGLGCEVMETVVVERLLSTDLEKDKIIIAPNPTRDVVLLTIEGHRDVQGMLEVDVLNLEGRILQSKKLSRYNGSFKGAISLYDYSRGVYLIRVRNSESNKLVRVVKQ
ncbi:MAG: T9SS type A sorting domain-containing protein [Ekhidna sp.]